MKFIGKCLSIIWILYFLNKILTSSSRVIGEFSFIGAGAVVTKEVPPYALLVGNPAKQIGWISEYGHRLEFNSDGEAECFESKEKYKLENNRVFKISK